MIALKRKARSRKVSQKMAEAQGSAGELSAYLRKGDALKRVKYKGERKASETPYKPRRSNATESPLSAARSTAPPVPQSSPPSSPPPRDPEARGFITTGTWCDEEDSALRIAVAIERRDGKTVSSWPNVARLVPHRTSKQCRERWYNHVCGAVKKDPWTEAEDATICRVQAVLGNKWSAIAQQLPGRTENQVKNRWNGKLNPKGRNRAPPSTCAKKSKTRSKSRGSPRSLVSDFELDAEEMQEAKMEMELRHIHPSDDIAFLDEDDADDDASSAPVPQPPDGDDAMHTITLGEVMRSLNEPMTAEQELMADETIDTADVDTVPVLIRGVSTQLCDTTRSSQTVFQEINAMLRARPDARHEAWDGLPAHIIFTKQLI